jgi:hypothetical protein
MDVGFARACEASSSHFENRIRLRVFRLPVSSEPGAYGPGSLLFLIGLGSEGFHFAIRIFAFTSPPQISDSPVASFLTSGIVLQFPRPITFSKYRRGFAWRRGRRCKIDWLQSARFGLSFP